jgi:putative endonuclease
LCPGASRKTKVAGHSAQNDGELPIDANVFNGGSVGIASGCMKGGAVYILASRSGVLYTGVTNRLDRRFMEHQRKLLQGFTAQFNVTRLVHYETFGDIRAAIAREKQIKGWLRKKKVALIEATNPSWRDLADDLFPNPTSP